MPRRSSQEPLRVSNGNEMQAGDDRGTQFAGSGYWGAQPQPAETQAFSPPEEVTQQTEQPPTFARFDQQGAGQAVEEVKEKASRAAENAREAVKGQFDGRTAQIGGQVSSIAADLKQAAEALRGQGSGTIVANLAEQAGDKIDEFAGYLQNADIDKLTEDVKRFAKQKPWVVATGLFALGFGASRLAKVSAKDNGAR